MSKDILLTVRTGNVPHQSKPGSCSNVVEIKKYWGGLSSSPVFIPKNVLYDPAGALYWRSCTFLIRNRAARRDSNNPLARIQIKTSRSKIGKFLLTAQTYTITMRSPGDGTSFSIPDFPTRPGWAMHWRSKNRYHWKCQRAEWARNDECFLHRRVPARIT